METKDYNSNQQQKLEKKKVSHWNIRPYLAIALSLFLVLSLSIIVFFMIYRYNGFTASWDKLTTVLQPITIGIIFAYLMNPIMMFFEKYLHPFLESRMKKKEKAKKFSRGLATIGALIVFILIIVLLLVLLLPQLIESIQGLIVSLPGEVQELIDRMNKFLKTDSQFANILEDNLLYVTDYLQNWAVNELLPKANTYLTSITSGLISFVKVLLNTLIGLIVSIYLLLSKETFIGQFKKLTYAIFSPHRANIVIETARKSNEIFGGFISGKILDSAIIGVICYIVLLITKIPYAVLVSVIVGVTNIIPFFGPLIGAVPSFVIIVLASPIHGLYFLIIVLVLQQVDGNIIGPHILGDSTGLSPFWIIFAITVGGGLFGFMGMLLGVPVFAVIYYIAQRIIYYFLRKKELPEETEKYVLVDSVDEKTNELRYLEKETVQKKKPVEEKE